MSRSGLIKDYLAGLSAELPAQVVEELADGLDQTHCHYLDQGLSQDAAARAAVGEFGEAQVVVAAFARASPARRTALSLLATGPAVGACWGVLLVTSHAWTWPVPLPVPILFGMTLITIIGLLAAGATGRRYRSVCRAGAAGCLGLAVLDAAMLMVTVFAIPAVVWPMIVAVAASAARIVFATQRLRPILALWTATPPRRCG
jgi:hypothetical protein